MPKAPKKPGRRPGASSKSGEVHELLKTGMTVTDIAKKVGCSANLVYYVKSRLSGPKLTGAKRGPGRTPKAKRGAGSADGLGDILAAVRSVEQERTQLRAVLEKVHAVLGAALA